MIKEKTFYKSFMVLALSLALQNLLTYGVNPVSYTHLHGDADALNRTAGLCHDGDQALQRTAVCQKIVDNKPVSYTHLSR